MALACVVLVAAGGCARLGAGSGEEQPRATAGGAGSCPQAVSWRRALDHVGERVTVVGPVVSTSYHPESNGRPTFINVGLDHPDPSRFTVVIFGDARGRFDPAPEDAYAAGRICVRGEVRNHRGVAEIIVERPAQIGR